MWAFSVNTCAQWLPLLFLCHQPPLPRDPTCVHIWMWVDTHMHIHMHTHTHTRTLFGCVNLTALTHSMNFHASCVCFCDFHASVPVETPHLPPKMQLWRTWNHTHFLLWSMLQKYPLLFLPPTSELSFPSLWEKWEKAHKVQLVVTLLIL